MQLVIDSSLYNPFLACLHWLSVREWSWAVTRGDWVTWSRADPGWPAAMCWPSTQARARPGVAGMLQFVDTFYISSDTWHGIMTPWHCLPLSISLALTSCCLLRHWPRTGSGKRLRVGAGAESLQRLQGRSRRQPPSTMSSNVRFYISFYIYRPLFMTTNPSDERLNWNVNLDFLCQLISPSCTFRYWLDHEIIERESPDWVWTLGV